MRLPHFINPNIQPLDYSSLPSLHQRLNASTGKMRQQEHVNALHCGNVFLFFQMSVSVTLNFTVWKHNKCIMSINDLFYNTFLFLSLKLKLNYRSNVYKTIVLNVYLLTEVYSAHSQ